MIGLILTTLLAADAGTDVPLADVSRVVSAVQVDGGALGPGWHLTPDRMQKVGEHIVASDNAKAQAERERDEAQASSGGGAKWFIYGAAIGVVTGGVLMVLGINAVSR